MKIVFNKGVRNSLAGELKKAAWMWGAVSGAAIIAAGHLSGLLAPVIGWLILQAMAHVLLGVQGDNGDESDK